MKYSKNNNKFYSSHVSTPNSPSFDSNWTEDAKEQIQSLLFNLEITQGTSIKLSEEVNLLRRESEELRKELVSKDIELAKISKIYVDCEKECGDLVDKNSTLKSEFNESWKKSVLLSKNIEVLMKENYELKLNMSTRFDELAKLAKAIEERNKISVQQNEQIKKLKNRILVNESSKLWKAAKVISKVFKKKSARNKSNEYIKLIEDSGLFDISWYETQCPNYKEMYNSPVEHYLYLGFKMGVNPSTKFNGNRYLAMYPDVQKEDVNPLLHYIIFGKDEGRPIL